MSSTSLPIVVSAPSGTGKTTVCARLRGRHPNLKIKVSHTTRPPRPGEIDGVNYHFIQESDFQKSIQAGEFLEWAQVHGHYYGTCRRTVENHLQNGDDLLMELDVQGVETLRKIDFDAVYILILPPSFEELKQRLLQRGTEPPGQVEKRLKVAKTEIARYHLYDYVVTNHKIDSTVDTILAILHAEKNRTRRFHSPSEDIQSILKPR
ncbi:MAG: guanylate kinase [Nitrospinaceae bacterium]